MGKYFLQAVNKHFGEDTVLRKLFNKNNIKVSYSCGPNIQQEIKGHNLKVLRKFREARNDPGELVDRTCNCRVATECPLDNKCLLKNLVYQATVKTEDGSAHSYIGQTTTTFKERWSNHKTSFKKAYKRNFSGLAKFIWDLKLQNKT